MVLYRQPLKLVDCRDHGPGSQSELFIVEGDSAAGAVVRLCDMSCQAVLPIQGKPLNAVRVREAAVRKNPFLAAVIDAIGTDIGEAFRLEQCRYEKVLLLCDPDADGIHCSTLLLLFFERWMPGLVSGGRIEMIRPPMMQIVGPEIVEPVLVYSEEEGQLMVKQLGSMPKSNITKQRFRGLAGIPQLALRSTCIDPATRKTEVMTLRDAEVCRRILLGE